MVRLGEITTVAREDERSKLWIWEVRSTSPESGFSPVDCGVDYVQHVALENAEKALDRIVKEALDTLDDGTWKSLWKDGETHYAAGLFEINVVPSSGGWLYIGRIKGRKPFFTYGELFVGAARGKADAENQSLLALRAELVELSERHPQTAASQPERYGA
jgi:hypothetical protein